MEVGGGSVGAGLFSRVFRALLRVHRGYLSIRWQVAGVLAQVEAIPAKADCRKARALRCFVRGKVLDEGESHVPEVRACVCVGGCVAVHCSVLQCVAVCCSVLRALRCFFAW